MKLAAVEAQVRRAECMARWWSEPLNPKKHRDLMSTTHIGGVPAVTPHSPLLKSRAYFVAVAGFTFEFVSLGQVREALSHFEQESQTPNRQPGVELEHYWQRWFERLPQWLFEKRRRVQVAGALRKALAEFESDPGHAA